ncbi:hypothetical protein CQW23_12707 [Capsicum baccatum]|uniref:Uncharacterized protein n=1 Tax=Capsicum baccatum TaxID=33114 RepID=A0A2G2WTK2_CAPBA|nr:hypothetical protein CQW23_12707 [Capsicum baccatum]
MLHRCSGVHHFNTSGSKLERFSMKVDDYKPISLENAPNLTEVSVMLDKVVLGTEHDLLKFLDGLSSVEILHLNSKFLHGMLLLLSGGLSKTVSSISSKIVLLGEILVPPILSTSPDSLKIIYFKGVSFMNFDEINPVVS